MKKIENIGYVLEEGEMTTEELCQWMGINKSTYQRSAKKYLARLENYADFVTGPRGSGKLTITKIYKANYEKGYNRFLIENVVRETERCIEEEDGMYTGVAGARRSRKNNEKGSCDGTVIEVLAKKWCKQTTELYGNGKRVKGILGYRTKTWAVRINEYNHHREMTTEEKKYFTELRAQFRKKNSLEEKEELVWYRASKNNEDLEDREEAKNEIEQIQDDFYQDVLLAFEEKYGGLPVMVSVLCKFEEE